MEILKLGRKDFDSQGKYIGKTDVSNYQGHIEIEENLGWVSFNSISATGYIFAKAGSGIKAGEGIKAGSGIEAGEGIVSGLSITCKLSLQFTTRLFAGICWWRKLQDDSEKTVTCGKLIGGEVCYGVVVETGIPNEQKTINLSGKEVEIKLDGNTYKAIIQ